ncbi:succinate dehydrogenase assembly factor 2 [Sulfitobacter guttiformis]|uniref:FAD assembly factor SdhE n=1 Tax=Sulfitobacter guttiformis TaxID=74349 RepID=A0A420DJX5_9RHOB|nr:succinate dehydrogenase assembly factor 2 [Sulfitobacter guttiformis]KIN71660.1 Sdh5 domain containing protein [Sulfitobacter guttiformis KCTC 32187]RKE94509.1 antitoxin CptB [Sulfitobacter guttiformis]
MFEMPRPHRPEGEPREVRIKRLAMRSMRRGIKEMDLILSAYATDSLDAMDDEGLTLYDDLLDENDHDLYQWVSGQFAPKAPYSDLIKDIQVHLSKG